MSESTLYWSFDDRNPAFMYGPGWSNFTDENAYDSTLSYTSNNTNVTIQFYGKAIWLFGAIGRTDHWDQPVSRYTLDNQYVNTVTADVKNETSYNELFAYFYDLDSSYHTLVVENSKEGATLFLDYYLTEPIPKDELAKSMGNLQTGGLPLSTSISEDAMFTSSPSVGGAAVGTIVGAAIGGALVALLIAIVAFIFWKRKRGTKPYYYKSASVYEVLSDEFKLDEEKRDPATPVVASHSSYIPTFLRKKYYPMPSEYRSQSLLAKSNSTRSTSSSHSGSSTHSSAPLLPHEP